MISFQSKSLRYSLDEQGKNVSLFSLSEQRELLDRTSVYCSRMTGNDGSCSYPVSASWERPILTVGYDNGALAKIRVEEKENYITFSLLSTEKDGGEYLDYNDVSFLDVASSIDYENSGFVTSCMSMSIRTKIKEYPGKNNLLLAQACPHIGIFGTKAALIGAKEEDIITIMREVLDEIPDGELPKGKYSGPYACDCKDAADTYMITSVIKREEIDAFIECCHAFGIKQVHFHQGGMFTQGDFRIIEENCPGGEQEMKEIISLLHRAEIKATLHPYTFFIDQFSTALNNPGKYLSPVPHRDLAVDVEYTLSEDIDEATASIPTVQSLHGVTNHTGFHESQSNFLWIDDELIFLKEVDTQGNRFTECVRGACGTTAGKHKKGAKVKRLLSYFTFLSPKKNSELFYEIARNTADFYNRMDFDGFYLDAIDGVFILDGNEYAWYHSMLFINELFRHLKKPPIFNCCYGPQYPSSWYARTRMGALDAPNKGYRDFIDVHVGYNRKNAERMFLVGELGWWNLYVGEHRQAELFDKIMFDEDIEYLCVKMLATNVSQCWLRNVLKYKEVPLLERYRGKITAYETLRRQGGVSDAIKKELCKPMTEYVLAGDGKNVRFRRALTLRKKAESFSDRRNVFTFDNPFAAQKPKIRIEALMTAGNYENEKAIVLLNADENAPVQWNKTWELKQEIDASGHLGMGVWIYGDGKGETVCFRLRNERHLSVAVFDRYVKVDFCGWRYFSLAENNNAELPHEDWPRKELEYKVYTDVESFYAYYTSPICFNRLKYLDVLLDPRLQEKDYEIRLRPVYLLPLEKPDLVNPSVTIGGKTVTFRTVLKSNTFLECDETGCFVYDRNGNILDRPEVLGDIPVLSSGGNEASLTCDNPEGIRRAALTFRILGETI